MERHSWVTLLHISVVESPHHNICQILMRYELENFNDIIYVHV